MKATDCVSPTLPSPSFERYSIRRALGRHLDEVTNVAALAELDEVTEAPPSTRYSVLVTPDGNASSASSAVSVTVTSPVQARPARAAPG